MKESLCWNCKNAYGSCPWSESFKPVPGWDAELIKTNCVNSYRVKKCPLFEAEHYFKQDENETVKEIADKLSCSVKTYYRLLKQGKIDKHGNKLKDFEINKIKARGGSVSPKNKVKQQELDTQKYFESQKWNKDLSGKMGYCIKCDHRNYPFLECCLTQEQRVKQSACATAFIQMNKEKKTKQASTKGRTVQENNTSEDVK